MPVKIDFSALDAIRKPDYIELKDDEIPADAPWRDGNAPGNKEASKRKAEPFISVDGKKDYRAMYRAVWEYHKQHYPPEAAPEYWVRLADDANTLAAQFSNDHFFIGLLLAVGDELEREYKQSISSGP